MRFRIARADTYPSGLVLPWATPLAAWPQSLLVEVTRGLSRNTVVFAAYRGELYAIKELQEPLALREYALLRALAALKLPVVEPVGAVTERTAGAPADRKALLVTRFLKHALPFRHVMSQGVTVTRALQLLDALAELLVDLHLAGFYWGDCSLSNALFRLDAGRYAAYLVDAETGELHPQLSAGQRRQDLEIAFENVAGEFLDLRAGGVLAAELDPADLARELRQRYEALWTELTREEVFSVTEQYRIDARIRRLNELGFDVDELDVHTIEGGLKIRLRVQVVEPGRHRRLLHALTGIDAQENQARRLLNDLYRYKACQQGAAAEPVPDEVAAYRWLHEVYAPALAAIPAAERAKLDGPEIFHQLLEHRWYLSERAGRDLAFAEVVPAYVREVLAPLPAPQPGAAPATPS